MATNSKISVLTYPLILFFVLGTLLISCKQPQEPPKNQVCITLKDDSSELGKRKHFICLDSIRIYRGDFDTIRNTMKERFPELSISDCETFNKKSLLEFLQMDTVRGLRIYYGLRPKKNLGGKRSLRLIIVGVDSLGRDVYIPNPDTTRTKKRMAAAAVDPSTDGGLEYGQCNPPCDQSN